MTTGTATTTTTRGVVKSVYTRADIRPHGEQAVVRVLVPILPLPPKQAPRTAAQLFRCGGAMYRTRINKQECWIPSPALCRHFSGPLAISRGLAFLAECKRDAKLRRIVESFGIVLEDWADQIEQAQLPENREIWA